MASRDSGIGFHDLFMNSYRYKASQNLRNGRRRGEFRRNEQKSMMVLLNADRRDDWKKITKVFLSIYPIFRILRG